jgi:hypothetical protein
MVALFVVLGVLASATLVLCVCLGVAASRADRASDEDLRAAGVRVPDEAEILAAAAEAEERASSASAQGGRAAPRPATSGPTT